MTSRTTRRFRECLARLPHRVRRQAKEAYRLFQDDPQHPSLRFKRVHPTEPVYAVRISRRYRALGVRSGESMVWIWVGSHADYDELLSRLGRRAGG